MRPGKKSQVVAALYRCAEALKEATREIETASPEPLTTIGSTWTDSGPRVLIGSSYALSVHEARRLVAQLVAAIYCCARVGNTPEPASEAREHAFLDALKNGLSHALTHEQIMTALHGKE